MPVRQLLRRACLRVGADPATIGRLMTTPPQVATSRAYALIGGLFYVSGGLAVILIVVTHPQLDHRLAMTAIGVVAVAAGLGVGFGAAHIAGGLRIAMDFVGTGMVLLVVLLAGQGASGEALFWLFCYVPIDAFVFFAWRWSLLMLAWGATATGIVIFGAHVMEAAEWPISLMVACVVAAAVGSLVRFGSEALHDSVTGMMNRRGFDGALAARCSDGNRAGRQFSLAAIKLDGLDSADIRDEDIRADQRVTELAAAWRRSAPRGASWSRMSGGGFTVLWDHPDRFEMYLERVLEQARNAGRPVSIGVCDFRPGHDPARMLNEAIAGRIFSARAGGDRITRSGLVAAQVADLRAAIVDGRIVAHYQPIIDFRTGEVVGAEALARWFAADQGLVGPTSFIPLAEESGDIAALGAAILAQACRDAAGWQSLVERPVRISVNVSGEQLHGDDFIQLVMHCLAESGLPAQNLTLEVTESTVGGDDPRAREILSELRLLGVHVAMDDFGTGYSNLARLSELPIDVLKIDQSFVRPLGRSGRGTAIAETLIGLAGRLRLTSVVEGIEREDQADLARGFGADLGQGWLYGAAMPNARFIDMLLGMDDQVLAKDQHRRAV